MENDRPRRMNKRRQHVYDMCLKAYSPEELQCFLNVVKEYEWELSEYKFSSSVDMFRFFIRTCGLFDFNEFQYSISAPLEELPMRINDPRRIVNAVVLWRLEISK